MKIIAYYNIHSDIMSTGDPEIFSFDMSKLGLNIPLPVGSTIDFNMEEKDDSNFVTFKVLNIEYYANRPDTIFLKIKVVCNPFLAENEFINILKTTWEGDLR